MSTNPNEYKVTITIERNDLGFPGQITREQVWEKDGIHNADFTYTIMDMIDSYEKALKPL